MQTPRVQLWELHGIRCQALETSIHYWLIHKTAVVVCGNVHWAGPVQMDRCAAKPRPKRGFGNSFQPAIDAPRLLPH
ncbi:unnamed protein product, partial [Vitis vinifera]|uniref:Uncharacterized protein n=2 Tax=rosids TaxID=71275 RepID=E0CQU7_VITVI